VSKGALNLSHISIFNEQRVLSPEKIVFAGAAQTVSGLPRRANRLLLCTVSAGPTTHQGDKKSEEPIFLSNSASQTLVKSAVNLSELRRLSILSFTFLSALLAATSLYLSDWKRASTVCLNFFLTFRSPLPTSSRKEREEENSGTKKQCKGFLKIIALFFNALQTLGFIGLFRPSQGPNHCPGASQPRPYLDFNAPRRQADLQLGLGKHHF
jgi:hypothetical protein